MTNVKKTRKQYRRCYLCSTSRVATRQLISMIATHYRCGVVYKRNQVFLVGELRDVNAVRSAFHRVRPSWRRLVDLGIAEQVACEISEDVVNRHKPELLKSYLTARRAA